MKAFLSIQEAAAYLGVEYKTIWRQVRKGEIPAAKIGGVYRIRREDLDALFAPAAVCASCGRPITGLLDRGGACRICGEPLCADCTLIDGQEVCRKCAKERGEARMRAQESAQEMPRCGKCGRVVVPSMLAGTCQEPDCTKPICRACWSQSEANLCQEHAPSKEQLLQQAKQALDRGDISRLVSSVEAKLAETATLARFDHKVREIETLRNPLDGSLYRRIDWERAHTQSDDMAALLDVLRVGFLDKAAADALPLNRSSRYTLPGPDVPKGEGMVIEMRFVGRLAAYGGRGFDTAPMGAAELLPMLESLGKESERADRAYMAGLVSPTGWAEDARQYVAADTAGRTFVHRYLLPVLIDAQTQDLFYNQSDDRLRSLIPLFVTLTIPGEEVSRVRAFVEDYLRIKSAVPVSEIERHLDIEAKPLRTLLDELQASGRYDLREVESAGMVVVRRGYLDESDIKNRKGR